MWFRLFSFLVLQVAGIGLGWYASHSGDSWFGALAGALIAGYLWILMDLLRGARLLRWLRNGEYSEISMGAGAWAEVADRVRRLVRARERAIADSDSRLQDFLAALQASPNGVVLLDGQGRIEWFNSMAADHFGFDPRRDMLQHFGNLVRDPAFASYYALRDFRLDVVMPGREHSSAKPVQLAVQLHPYGEGRSLLLSRDITAVEQAEAMRRDFVANVSHEIRTPLTVLAGFVETLQTLDLNETERTRYLALMAQQAERMQTLVHDLLMLSKLEGSPLPPAADWVGIGRLMAQCEQEANDLSHHLGNVSQDIVFHSEADFELAGSDSELHSAMFNLIGNAVRYTPAGKRIDVRWQRRADGAAVFSVVDAGPGIAPEHIPRLTERFYRVDRSRSRDTGGTGLGLAIVKHVAQRHGAELVIQSTPGRGSSFTLNFQPHRVR